MKRSLIFLFVLFSFSVQAENDAPWWKIWHTTDEAVGVSNHLFTHEEREILDEYLRSQGIQHEYPDDRNKHKNKKSKKQKPLPPGLQKKIDRGGQLPPGWQKKVARGEVLGGDLYNASRGLPRRVLDRLENQEGTSVRQVEDRVVRIMDATGVILDVLGRM